MSAPFAVRVPAGYRVGCWQVREPLAAGAFGSVYAAVRTSGAPAGLPAEAALKFLPTGTRTPRQLNHLRELSQRELAMHRKLSRPRLIRMYEALTVDDPARPELDGATVLVLERAEGSLDALLAREPVPAAGPVLLAQVCEGIHQLHHAGWVHGDLKPGNVLLMADGTVRLGDFNLAAEMDGTHAYAPAFATPDYTPPELLWSEISDHGRQVRPTTDVWAFGVLAHLVLTGKAPLPGGGGSGGGPAARSEALLSYARGDADLHLDPGLPAPWRPIVTDCLARTHEERSAHTAAALLRRIEAVTDSSPSPRLPRLRPRSRRAVRTLWGAALAVLLAGASLGFLALRGDGTVPAAEYGAAELATDKDVPVAYRKLIVDSAHQCGEKDVTPAQIAAILKVESDFDPDLSDPANDEFGIARWTPRVVRYWLRSNERPATGNPKPPFPPEQSIPALGRYLCAITPELWPGLNVSTQVAGALAHRSSARRVNEWGGAPAKLRPHADKVAHYLKEYAGSGGQAP
ncbi:protein kinase [Streptomyces sp. NPDC091272]|uniref:protein kinase domain-containing protein n=1 Tax=Streptomyces sp. NPDC091272 TaxID=3365981 RepID=UPI00380445AC